MKCPRCTYAHCSHLHCGSCGWKREPEDVKPAGTFPDTVDVADEETAVVEDKVVSIPEESAESFEASQSVQDAQVAEAKKGLSKVRRKTKPTVN